MGQAFTGGLQPINAMMGWNEGVESKNDAIELAKGFINQRYIAKEASWYAVAPFSGGYLWEVHEGGPGKGYLGAVMDALKENPSSTFWFPSGDRVFQMMMRDGKPFGILLSKKDSLAVLNSDQPPLAMVTKMKPAVRKGTGWLLTGSALSGTGFLFFASSLVFYGLVANPGPSVPAANFSEMPHAQWNRVIGTEVEEIVSKLELANGNWSVDKRPHVIEGMSEIREEGRAIIQRALDNTAEIPEIPDDPLPVQSEPIPEAPEPTDSDADADVQAQPIEEPELPAGLSAAERRQALREARERQSDQAPVPASIENTAPADEALP